MIALSLLAGVVIGVALLLGVLTGLAWKRKRAEGPPPGWVFYSADFSLNARDPLVPGHVMFERDGPGRRIWAAMPDNDRETFCLFVCGQGLTFREACDDATRSARKLIQVERETQT